MCLFTYPEETMKYFESQLITTKIFDTLFEHMPFFCNRFELRRVTFALATLVNLPDKKMPPNLKDQLRLIGFWISSVTLKLNKLRRDELEKLENKGDLYYSIQ